MGSVFDESFLSVTGKKLQHIVSCEPVCKTCNLDPLNGLTEELRAVADGQSDAATVDSVIESISKSNAWCMTLQPDSASRCLTRRRSHRRVEAFRFAVQ